MYPDRIMGLDDGWFSLFQRGCDMSMSDRIDCDHAAALLVNWLLKELEVCHIGLNYGVYRDGGKGWIANYYCSKSGDTKTFGDYISPLTALWQAYKNVKGIK